VLKSKILKQKCYFIQNKNNFLFNQRHVLSQLRQRAVEPGEEDGKNTGNKSNHFKQTSLFGYALMAGALITLIA